MSFKERMADLGGTVRDGTAKDGVRPTGQQLFDAMTEAEQDEAFGPEIAAAVRSGEVKLSDLVVKSPMEGQPDFITQASLTDLGLDPKD